MEKHIHIVRSNEQIVMGYGPSQMLWVELCQRAGTVTDPPEVVTGHRDIDLAATHVLEASSKDPTGKVRFVCFKRCVAIPELIPSFHDLYWRCVCVTHS